MKSLKKIFFLLTFILLIIVSINNVSADIGPKPSVHITFSNNPYESFYITLIAKEGRGPWYTYEPGEEGYQEYYERLDEIEKKLLTYNDVDGYHYIGYYEKIDQKNTSFTWGYYAPDNFKVLIYNEDTDEFISNNEILVRYAYSAYYNFDFENQYLTILPTPKKTYNYAKEIINLIIRIIATILIELLVALLFRFKKKELLFIAVVNTITQLGLNIFLNITNYNYGILSVYVSYFFIEFFIFIIEAIAYSIYLKIKVKPKHPILKSIFYSLIANLLSYGIGMFIIIKFL